MIENMDFHCPPSIKNEILDQYLEKGWYRIGSEIFTTNITPSGLDWVRVYWTRYHVHQIQLSKSSKQLLKKADPLSFSIEPFSLTEEMELLHDVYFSQIDFLTNYTIKELLVDTTCQVYDTYKIEVRSGNKLIGLGIFDQGKNTIAGIKNIYHPDYKSFSLGKLLVLKKLEYCKNNNIEWYYPGYIAPGNSRFDYKLFLDKSATEILSWEKKRWITYQEFLIDQEKK
jgi:arginyl-tRNA--protein-N-Asp/Glu arginylyltransferase